MLKNIYYYFIHTERDDPKHGHIVDYIPLNHGFFSGVLQKLKTLTMEKIYNIISLIPFI